MIAMTALVLGLGVDAGLSLKWSAILSAMLGGTWFALARTAQDPRWSVAYAGSLLTGTSLALVAGALSPLLGAILALWTGITAWRLARSLGRGRTPERLSGVRGNG